MGMSKNVCSIYKYTVGMLYGKVEKTRQKRDFICLMRIKTINHVKMARKIGRSIKVYIIIISERACAMTT